MLLVVVIMGTGAQPHVTRVRMILFETTSGTDTWLAGLLSMA